MISKDVLSPAPVIIIGAGPAGLTAAYELCKLGKKSLLLEADKQVGGISKTVNYKGYRFDIGGHRFFSKSPYVNQLWHEILGEDFLERPRLSRIYYHGHFFDYPLKASNALHGLGFIEALRVMLSFLKAQLFQQRGEQNFEEWVSNRFGYRLYKIFFKTYTEKVWGIPCKEISSDWAAQRIKNLSLSEALRNALFASKKSQNGDIITTLIDKFNYPRLGPGMMWETCKNLLNRQHIPIHLEEPVFKIYHSDGRIEKVLSQNKGGEVKEYSCEHVISSMPLRHLIHALHPKPPEKILQSANKLRYRDFLTVVLIVNRKDVFPDNWIYIHSPEVKMGRIQNYKNWSAEMVPDETTTSLGLEYFLWDNDKEWDWPDHKLIEFGTSECVKMGLIQPEEVIDGTVVRMQKAYPVYDQSYHENLEILRDYLSTFKNLQTVGRNGLHRYNNQDHSMLTGVYAAQNVVGKSLDVWSVNTEQEYHETKTFGKTSTSDRLTPTRIVPQTATFEEPYDRTKDEIYAKQMIQDFFSRIEPVAFGIAVGVVTGVMLFFITAIVLLKDVTHIAPKLSLLGHYLLGFDTSWAGAVIGLFEGAFGGFIFGFSIAQLRNWATSKYSAFVRSRLEAKINRNLLDKV